MKSWKTTLAGAIAALGAFLAEANGIPEWLQFVGKLLAYIGTAGIGLFARDNNVSSEVAGAK